MRGGTVSVCVVALIAAVAAPGVASRPATKQRLVVTERETALVITINSVRRLHLLPRLRIDRRLVRAARSHSRDMLRNQYFAHGDFGRRMRSFHVRGRRFAENIVWSSGVMSANEAVAAWLESPPHRANLLDPRLRRIGVATPVGAFDGYSPATVITADFAGR
jgi:uncharacterized protein YkwD